MGIFADLAGIRPLQRVSIFVDDVVLFLKLMESELRAVKALLHVFGDASGLKVNYRKTIANLDLW